MIIIEIQTNVIQLGALCVFKNKRAFKYLQIVVKTVLREADLSRVYKGDNEYTEMKKKRIFTSVVIYIKDVLIV